MWMPSNRYADMVLQRYLITEKSPPPPPPPKTTVTQTAADESAKEKQEKVGRGRAKPV